MTLPQDPYSLPYWKAEIQAGRAPDCLDPAGFRNLDQVALALEAAFELRDFGVATRICEQWVPYLDPNRTENKSPWLRRELLYFLRGKTDVKWVDLLLAARACPTQEVGQGFLFEAFEEVFKQIERGDTDGLSRLCLVAPKLLDNGASMNDGSPGLAPELPRLRALVVEHCPDELGAWDALVERMHRHLDEDAAHGEVVIRLEDAIDKEDFSALGTLLPAFLDMPRPRRRLCPLSRLVARHDKSPSYPVVEGLRCLLAAGLPVREAGPYGQAPLMEIIDSRTQPAQAEEMVRLLLAAGADANQQNEQAWAVEGRVSALDRPLHGCSLRVDPPVEALVAGGALVDALDDRNMTPLMYACREGNLVAMRKLLEAGATVHHRNEFDADAMFEYLENLFRRDKDFTMTPEEMADGFARLVASGADPMTQSQGQSAWNAMLSSLDAQAGPARAERWLRELTQALVDQQCPLDWATLHAQALQYDHTTQACAIMQQQLLDMDTHHPAARLSPRRM